MNGGDTNISDSEIPFLGASEVARLILNKKLSSVELTQLMLSRIAEIDNRINAINVLLKEEANSTTTDESQNSGHADIDIPSIDGKGYEGWNDLGNYRVDHRLQPIGSRCLDRLDWTRIDGLDRFRIKLA